MPAYIVANGILVMVILMNTDGTEANNLLLIASSRFLCLITIFQSTIFFLLIYMTQTFINLTPIAVGREWFLDQKWERAPIFLIKEINNKPKISNP